MKGCYRSLACVLLLVLAGCSGFVPDDTAPATDRDALGNATGTGTTTVVETATPTTSSVDDLPDASDLPVNETLVFERTEYLLGGDFEAVTVVVHNETMPRRVTDRPFGGEFTAALGIENATRSAEFGTGGEMLSANSVSISISNRSTPADIRAVLVHEYAHATNYQRASYRNVRGMGRPNAQGSRAAWTIHEGSATYVAQAYAARYGNTTPNQANVCDAYDDGAPATRLQLGRYCVGARYIDDRIDDPANLDDIYRNPPNTTEQVRHGYRPQEEPPIALTVNATQNDDWWILERARQGELWTYAVLSKTLSDERADEAATGWGNDTVLSYTNAGRAGYAWVTRWDSTADGDEFEAAMRAHAANATTGDVTNASFAIKRLDATTVVVLVGDDAFVNDESVTVGEDGVHVRPPESTNDTARTTGATS